LIDSIYWQLFINIFILKKELNKCYFAAFGTQKKKLDTLPKKVQKIIAYLNDISFWFGCKIATVSGIKIFKYVMKFLKSCESIFAHEINFFVQKLQVIVKMLK
jgi:hypothetical protein